MVFVDQSNIVSSLLDTNLPIKLVNVHALILSIRSQYYNVTEYILDFTFDGPYYEFAYFYVKNNAMINVSSYYVLLLISYGIILILLLINLSLPISLFPSISKKLLIC